MLLFFLLWQTRKSHSVVPFSTSSLGVFTRYCISNKGGWNRAEFWGPCLPLGCLDLNAHWAWKDEVKFTTSGWAGSWSGSKCWEEVVSSDFSIAALQCYKFLFLFFKKKIALSDNSQWNSVYALFGVNKDSSVHTYSCEKSICASICTHTCIHTHAHTCTHVCTNTYKYACVYYVSRRGQF